MEGQDEWIVVLGHEGTFNLELDYTMPVGAVDAGDRVQARYRVKNQIGWSEFSKNAYLLQAGVAYQPPPPIFVSASAN